MYIIAFTGHRPPKVGGYDATSAKRVWVRGALRGVIEQFMADHDALTAITGGALGVDQDAAAVCFELGVPYRVYVPCVGHDSKWPFASRQHYQQILARADSVRVIHDGPYNFTCMQQRNQAMVDDADALVAVWDGTSGGTANCVRYGRAADKPLTVINPADFS